MLSIQIDFDSPTEGIMMREIRNKRASGFTLVETMLSMSIVMITALGVVASIIYTRQSLELDKQKLAAMNYARQAMEAALTNSSLDAGTRTLVPFNQPGLEIAAQVVVDFFPIDNNGRVDWGTILGSAPLDMPALCRVTVSWQPSGSWSRTQMIRYTSIVRAGTL
ncbi:hypothetical protein CVU37_08580 [candidate division BRC1 bacterium HGW-BRC1-1]|nr:MAG: hypothetical protein CVU37_08580 [candidate division BRC1 bacterium HGW-BRC1-1]